MRAFLQVRPELYLGHYHHFVDQTVEYAAGDEKFETRTVLLDMNGANTRSQGILDVHNLSLDVFARHDDVVTRLTGAESGRWRVTTQRSSHLFDFDARTVQRVPGPDAHPMWDDGVLPLLEIKACRVGERGFWAIRSNDDAPKQWRRCCGCQPPPCTAASRGRSYWVFAPPTTNTFSRPGSSNQTGKYPSCYRKCCPSWILAGEIVGHRALAQQSRHIPGWRPSDRPNQIRRRGRDSIRRGADWCRAGNWPLTSSSMPKAARNIACLPYYTDIGAELNEWGLRIG